MDLKLHTLFFLIFEYFQNISSERYVFTVDTIHYLNVIHSISGTFLIYEDLKFWQFFWGLSHILGKKNYDKLEFGARTKF
jgi:hypothetical protein